MKPNPLHDAFDAIRLIRQNLNSLEGSLTHYLIGSNHRQPNAVQIMVFVASFYRVDPKRMIKRKCRQEEFCVPRSVAVWVMRMADEDRPIAYETIGKHVNRDHGSAINAFRAINDRRSVDDAFKKETDTLLEETRKILGYEPR